jgi:hypothetical protein
MRRLLRRPKRFKHLDPIRPHAPRKREAEAETDEGPDSRVRGERAGGGFEGVAVGFIEALGGC